MTCCAWGIIRFVCNGLVMGGPWVAGSMHPCRDGASVGVTLFFLRRRNRMHGRSVCSGIIDRL